MPGVLLDAMYHIPMYGDPESRYSVYQLLNFLEAAAVYDRCLFPLFMWPDKRTWFVDHSAAFNMTATWLKPYGFSEAMVSDLAAVVDYPVDPLHWLCIENYLKDRKVQDGNTVLHTILQAEFARRNALAYAPAPRMGEPFALKTLKALQEDFHDIVLRAYRELREDIHRERQMLAEEGAVGDIDIPPIAGLILSRSRTCADVGAALCEVREEMATTRQCLSEYQRLVLDPDAPLGKRVQSRNELVRIVTKLKEGIVGWRNSVFQWTDILALPDQLFDGADWRDFKSSSILKYLLTKPAEFVLRSRRRRKLGVLFRARKHLYEASVRKDIKRLFGERALTEEL
jgi:hypothetical protein